MKHSEETSSLAGEAYVILRERILRNELPIGKVISRRKLANELGMSLLPVSEAFLRLEFEGLLESRPRAGTRVRIPSREDIRGHYVVREALDESLVFEAQERERDRQETHSELRRKLSPRNGIAEPNITTENPLLDGAVRLRHQRGSRP